MEPLHETAWFQSWDQTQPTGLVSANDALFQVDDALGYDFSLPNLDNNFDQYSQPAQFPNLQCFGISGSARTKSRVSLACIPCRSRHTRCDAITPVCSQCHVSGRSCSYTQSRRGRVKLARLERRQQLQRNGETSERGQLHGVNAHSSSSSGDASSAFITHNGQSQGQSPVGLSISPHQVTKAGSKSDQGDSINLLDLYYASFHDSHPIILPRKFFERRLQKKRQSLLQLLPVMEFIGSLFAARAPREALRLRVENMLQSDHLMVDAFCR